MKRPSRDIVFMITAMAMSLRGTCLRAKVGAVIVKDKRIVSIGYNGSVPGEAHCTSDSCLPDEPCKNAVHAEANAIYFAARKGIGIEGATLFCTHSPCPKCTEAIIQAGISEVVYLKEYRDTPFESYRETKIRKLDNGIEIYNNLQTLTARGVNFLL